MFRLMDLRSIVVGQRIETDDKYFIRLALDNGYGVEQIEYGYDSEQEADKVFKAVMQAWTAFMQAKIR